METNKFITVTNKAGDELELLLYDVIGEDWYGGTSAKSVAQEIGAAKDAKTINVRINSPGGNVFEGFAIYNALRQHSAKVIVNIDGFAASIASVIAMAGDTVRIAENAQVMIHNPRVGVWGESDELRRNADLLDSLKDGILQSYFNKSDAGGEELSQMMDAETWLDANEALALGLVDEVAKPLEMAAQFDFKRLGLKAPASVASAPDTTETIGEPMADENKTNEPENKVETPEPAPEAVAPEATPAPALVDPRAEAKRFVDAFGDQGGAMYAEGLTFDQASAKHIENLAEANSAQAKEIEDLKTRITNESGEENGVSVDSQDDSGQSKSKKSGLLGALENVITVN